MPIISRSDNQYAAPDGTKSGLIPHEFSTQIIESAKEQSAALGTFRSVSMPTGVQHMPVLQALPVATWVTGEPNDTDGTGGEKTPTSQLWQGLVLTAEEIAAIVVIPEATLEDASINLWEEITPRIGESVGKAIDAAVFAGTNAPASWPDDIYTAAVAAGNVTVAAAPAESDYDAAIADVEGDGFFPEQFYAKIGQRSVFRSMNASGVPTYLSEIRGDGRVDSIYGIDIRYDRLNVLHANNVAVVGDPSMAIMGTRVDLQYKFLSEATLDLSSAQDGSAMVSLAQQDAVALRVRGRFGFAVANPVTHLEGTEANRYPFAVINAT
jgi:hypothetical protein